jgi:hypothetical protein
LFIQKSRKNEKAGKSGTAGKDREKAEELATLISNYFLIIITKSELLNKARVLKLFINTHGNETRI